MFSAMVYSGLNSQLLSALRPSEIHAEYCFHSSSNLLTSISVVLKNIMQSHGVLRNQCRARL